MWSIWRWFWSMAASPLASRRLGGSGVLTRRGPSAPPPPARLCWAMAWAFRGFSSDLALTSTTSSVL